jgi:alanyl-tRNA synthetase
VLRKILRRGIRHGRLLGQEQPFLFEMVYAVRDLMQGAYPELIDSADRVARVVKAEEQQFDRVLKIGTTRLDEELQGVFTGEKAFHLYETFGLAARLHGRCCA